MKAAGIVGIVLVVLGAAVLLGSIVVDLIIRSTAGFGFRQIAGIVVGALDVVLGIILLLNKKSS